MLINTNLNIGDVVSVDNEPYEPIIQVGIIQEKTSWRWDDGIDVSYSTKHHSFCESDIGNKVKVKMNVNMAIRIIAEYALSKSHVIVVDDLINKIKLNKARLTYAEEDIVKNCNAEVKYLIDRS